MNVWDSAIITDKGLALQSKLIAGNSLEITRAIASTGYIQPGLLHSQTEVIDAKMELQFRAVSYPEYGRCKLPLFLTNDDVTESFKCRSIYIMANDPDEGEIVFFIAQAVTAEEGTTVPTASEMPGYSAEWTFYFQYGRADNVTVLVDPTGYVSRTEMEEYVASAMSGFSVSTITTEEIDAAFESAST